MCAMNSLTGNGVADGAVLESVEECCIHLLGAPPDSIDYPGGKSRKSIRVWVSGQSFILSSRRSEGRAQLEAGVLHELHKAGAPVPELLVQHGKWVVQKDLGDNRLSIALNSVAEHDQEALLGKVLESIEAYQLAAMHTGLGARVAEIGQTEEWNMKFAQAPMRLAGELSMKLPKYPVADVASLLKIEQPQFIKWDARLGNALLDDQQRVYWIDWEHAGKRHPMDDVAWMLGDEYMPELDPVVEARLIDAAMRMLGCSEKDLPYFFLMGTLHMTIRLALIVDRKADKDWWDPDKCMQLDHIGVVKKQAITLARRASRWCEIAPCIKSLQPFYDELVAYIEKQ